RGVCVGPNRAGMPLRERMSGGWPRASLAAFASDRGSGAAARELRFRRNRRCGRRSTAGSPAPGWQSVANQRIHTETESMANSQKFIARNRAPRVQIEYDVEVYGAQKKVQIPFVMGVLSDLSGANGADLPPVDERKALEIDVDNFD